MIPTNGVLIGLGKAALVEYDAGTGTVVPARATHFAFGFTSTSDKTRTHGHAQIAGQDCILQPGQLYCLHTHTYKPTIKKNSAANDTFQEVSFYRIDTRP
jgi:hypothetical protein